MNLPNLAGLADPRQLSGLDAQTLREVQVALARIGFAIRTIDGLYGPNTRNAWAEFKIDLSPGDSGLITPGDVALLSAKIAVLETIEAGPQTTKDEVIAAIAAECKALELPLKSQLAYIVATTSWETNQSFAPVSEAYYLADPMPYLRSKPYFPFYGRGYVQLTWQSNYQHYADILGLDLVGNPDLAKRSDVALFVLVQGFKRGAFTGRKITDYINENSTDFVNARRCINAADHATNIADLAQGFMNSLPG